MLLRRCVVSQDGKQIGRRSAYQFWLLPSSLWHVLLVRSLKAPACLPRHTPPQYPWLKCDWRSQCRAKLATQRLCWVMLITQTHCQCRHDWKQPIMEDLASQRDLGTLNSIWDMQKWNYKLFSFDTTRRSAFLICVWAMGNGCRQIYCISRAGSNWNLFVKPWNNISVPWIWSFACI